MTALLPRAVGAVPLGSCSTCSTAARTGRSMRRSRPGGPSSLKCAKADQQMDVHDMRVLMTGIDAAGRSCVVGSDRVLLECAPGGGFGHAVVFDTPSEPPAPRPPSHSSFIDVGIAPGLVRWIVVDYDAGQEQPMHATDTVDLDIVLRGSIELVLDDGTHLLEAGDGAVINGVDHGWRAGPDGCRLSVTFIGTPSRT
jgi:quercetin dioxygenase-like cupin family protein